MILRLYTRQIQREEVSSATYSIRGLADNPANKTSKKNNIWDIKKSIVYQEYRRHNKYWTMTLKHNKRTHTKQISVHF